MQFAKRIEITPAKSLPHSHKIRRSCFLRHAHYNARPSFYSRSNWWVICSCVLNNHCFNHNDQAFFLKSSSQQLAASRAPASSRLFKSFDSKLFWLSSRLLWSVTMATWMATWMANRPPEVLLSWTERVSLKLVLFELQTLEILKFRPIVFWRIAPQEQEPKFKLKNI